MIDWSLAILTYDVSLSICTRTKSNLIQVNKKVIQLLPCAVRLSQLVPKLGLVCLAPNLGCLLPNISKILGVGRFDPIRQFNQTKKLTIGSI